MATLVLSAVGTAIGGPVGGALGSMIGQAIDTNLFGPGPRRGPRLDDLKVQTSSYGTQIPRLYGRMRVAGTVVWATDLKETEVVEGGGKGSPETIHYNYSCSFAVALSSRPIRDVGRIWADGKLIRGEAGDLKVKGVFRFLAGGEDQLADPLIASLEGSGGTPAYRGLALAIFEDLDLAEYGNRLPMLTFETVADSESVGAAGIVGDVCEGSVFSNVGSGDIVGFAALGSDRRSAIEGLVDLNGLRLVEGEESIDVGEDVPASLVRQTSDGGWSADRKAAPAKGEWTREPAASVPESLSVRYHEPTRDYQAGLMKAAADGGRGEAMFDSASTLTADVAKGWAERALARRWAGRDRLTLTLSTDWVALRPGDQLDLDWRAGRWTVEEVLVEAFAVKVNCRRSADPGIAVASEPGRGLPQPDIPIAQSIIGLFEVPMMAVADDKVRLQVAVSCDGAFKRVGLTSGIMGAVGPSGTAWRKARLGVLEERLTPAHATVIDRDTSIVVALVDQTQVLLNADADALDAGANLAMIGDEMIQFGRAEPMGGGRYRLSQLLRGRGGSEWAMDRHQAGDPFVMVDSASLVALAFDASALGSDVEVSAYGVADDQAAPPTLTRSLSGSTSAPLAPCHLTLSQYPSVQLAWVRRARERWVWDEGSDAALPITTYAVSIVGSAGSLQRSVTGETMPLSQSNLDALGSGVIRVAVRELGARRPSEPATAQFAI